MGSSEAYELVYTTWSDRWQDLTDRNLDVLAGGDSYRLEREVMEVSCPSMTKEPIQEAFYRTDEITFAFTLELHRIELCI